MKCILCLEMKTATTTLSAQICTSIIEHAPLGLLCSASAQVIYSQGHSGFSTCIRSLHFVKLSTKQDTSIVSALQIMNGEGWSHRRHTMYHWNDQTWIISLTVMLHTRTISRPIFSVNKFLTFTIMNMCHIYKVIPEIMGQKHCRQMFV